MRVIAAVPAAGLLCGCGIGLLRPELPPVIVFVCVCGAVALSVVAALGQRATLLAVAVSAGCAASGVLLSQRAWQAAWRPPLRLAFESIAHDERLAQVAPGQPVAEDDRASVLLEGVLRDDAALTDGGAVSLRVGVRWIGRRASTAPDPAANPVRGDVVLTVGGTLGETRMLGWRRGRVVRATAQLRRPTRYFDPGVADQERALARRGIALVGSVKSAALVEVVARAGPLDEAAASLRAFTRTAVNDAVGRWSAPAASVVTAILIGDRTGLDSDIQRRLQEAGTYHVIAISGGNIAILAGITLAAFRWAGFLGRGAMLAAIAGLAGYGFVVTGGASVDRATSMAIVYFAGRALDLRGPSLNALALVAGILVAADPLAVADPAFLLTFGATAAILLAGDVRLHSGLPAAARPVVMLGLASLVAEAVLFPIGALFFSRVTVAGLALNFVAIPAMAVTQIVGTAILPVFAVSARLASAIGAVAAVGAEMLLQSARLVDMLPVLTWRVATPSLGAMLIYYGAIGTWWTLQRRRAQTTGSAEAPAAGIARRASAWVAATVAVCMATLPWTVGNDGRLHVTFLDVGQGDAALIRFPGGRTMLVDAGGGPSGSAFDVGDRIVGAALRALGVRHLDTIVLTHGDADHIGGALSVIREFRPDDVWEGIPVPPSLPLQKLRAAARNKGSRWIRVQRGDELFVDDVRVIVRHPELPDWERQNVRNDDSVVVELQWRDVSVVLSGDIGRPAEETLAGAFEPVSLRVVKVPHHGSLTSSSEQFLAGLRPTVAVVSVGRSNSFGHPAPRIMQRYETAGAQVFRTDRDGAVTVDTDGRSLTVTTFIGRGQRSGADAPSRGDQPPGAGGVQARAR